MVRPRIDLDGIPLSDPDHRESILAVFRVRTTSGLVVLMPESGEVTVPFTAVRSASADLVGGRITIELDPGYARAQTWLRGATTLSGSWLDRVTITNPSHR